MNDEGRKGIALITAVILLLVLVVLGTGLIILANTELKISKSFSSNMRGLYLAEAGIHHVAAMQNDHTIKPQYLKNSNAYQTEGVDPFFVDYEITDPSDTPSLWCTIPLFSIKANSPEAQTICVGCVNSPLSTSSNVGDVFIFVAAKSFTNAV